MKVAVLVDGSTVPNFFKNAISQMDKNTEASIELIVKNEDAGNSTLELVKKGVQKPHWGRIKTGQMLSHKIFGVPEYKKPVDIENISAFRKASIVSCSPQEYEGLGITLPSEVVDQIVDQSDVVIRSGFGVIQGEILTRPKYGVLSYHHGDPREYRGGPAGFWEFMHGRDRAGIMLQRLKDELDAGKVIIFDEVDIRSAKTWNEVQRRQFKASESFLAEAIRNVNNPEFEPQEMELGPIRTAPQLKIYLRYLIKNNTGRLL